MKFSARFQLTVKSELNLYFLQHTFWCSSTNLNIEEDQAIISFSRKRIRSLFSPNDWFPSFCRQPVTQKCSMVLRMQKRGKGRRERKKEKLSFKLLLSIRKPAEICWLLGINPFINSSDYLLHIPHLSSQRGLMPFSKQFIPKNKIYTFDIKLLSK